MKISQPYHPADFVGQSIECEIRKGVEHKHKGKQIVLSNIKNEPYPYPGSELFLFTADWDFKNS